MKLKDRFIRFMYGRYGVDSFGKFTIWIPDPYADRRMDASGNPFLAGMGRYHLFLFPDVFQKYLQTSRRESEISADDTRHPDIFLQAA